MIDSKRGQLANLIYQEKKGELSPQDSKKLTEIMEMLERLETVKIIDAPVLLNLQNLYRVQLRDEDFEWAKSEQKHRRDSSIDKLARQLAEE